MKKTQVLSALQTLQELLLHSELRNDSELNVNITKTHQGTNTIRINAMLNLKKIGEAKK